MVRPLKLEADRIEALEDDIVEDDVVEDDVAVKYRTRSRSGMNVSAWFG